MLPNVSNKFYLKQFIFQARFNTKFLIQFFRPAVFPIILVLIQNFQTLHQTNAIQLRNLCHTYIPFTHIVTHFWN